MKKGLAAVLLIVSAALNAEESRLLVAGAVADSSIAAPTLLWRVNHANGDGYRLSLSGWTMEGAWRRQLSGSRAFLLSAEATPLHAHNSNRVYVNGERAKALEYDSASYRVKAGLRITHNARAATEAHLVALSEQVDEIAGESLRQFWANPYAGIELTHTYSRRGAEDPLIATWDGIELSARGEAFAGDESWTRLVLSEAASKTFGRIDARQSVVILNGSSLNAVNRFLVGGSWDTLGPTALYGYRYGEYRVAHAVIGSAGADYILPRQWRVGVRASYMRSDVADTWGSAVNASKIWRTFGVNMGIGFPRHPHGTNDPMAYVSVVAPLYYR